MLKKIVIAFGLFISAFVLVVGGLYAKGGQAEVLLWVVKIFLRVAGRDWVAWCDARYFCGRARSA